MRVLLMEASPGDGLDVTVQLERAGHTVARCHDPGEPAFPCRDLTEGEACPLVGDGVSVAVLVRHATSPAGRSAGEDGARCALRHHVPLVIAGDLGDSPYGEWASDSITTPSAVAEAVVAVASAPLERHQDAALRSFQAVLAQHGVADTDARASVRRHGADLRVTLTTQRPLPARVAEMCSVRSVAGIRQIDSYARRIDVSVEESDNA
jgi:hypothetical protein